MKINVGSYWIFSINQIQGNHLQLLFTKNNKNKDFWEMQIGTLTVKCTNFSENNKLN